ncbi:MAG: hypothetical protein N2200_01220 [Bacteroidia bacterium]|nr:hypothetical protein [Bacteroidia bacterium]
METAKSIDALDGLLVPVPEERLQDVLETIQAKLCTNLNAGASLLYICDAVNHELYIYETGSGISGAPIPERFTSEEGFLGQVVKERRALSERFSTKSLGNLVSSSLIQDTEINISAVPLLYQDQVEGVWCIASEGDVLSTLSQPVWQDFLYKWAAYLQSIRSRRYIQALLEKSQVQNQELITREEELRQNLEELAVTQEEMHRAQQLLAKQTDNQNFVIDLFTLMAAAIPANLRSLSRIFLAQLTQYFHGEGSVILFREDTHWRTLFSWIGKKSNLSFPADWSLPPSTEVGLEQSRKAGCYSASDLGLSQDEHYWVIIPYYTSTGLTGLILIAFLEPFPITAYDSKSFLHIGIAYFTAYERVMQTVKATLEDIEMIAKASQAQVSIADINAPIESLPWLTEIPLVQRESYIASLKEALQKEIPLWLPPESVATKELLIINDQFLQRMKWS